MYFVYIFFLLKFLKCGNGDDTKYITIFIAINSCPELKLNGQSIGYNQGLNWDLLCGGGGGLYIELIYIYIYIYIFIQ